MAKTIGSLEKEVALWKVRYEKASKSLMETTEEVSLLTILAISVSSAVSVARLFHTYLLLYPLLPHLTPHSEERAREH